MVKENTSAVFNIDNDQAANPSYGEWRVIESIGIKAVNEYSSVIEQQAKAKGVDHNLVKAIVYIEHAQIFHDNVATALLGWADLEQKSIKPMNVRRDVWLGLVQNLGYTQQDFDNPTANIAIGVELVKRIQDRLAPEDRTPDKIYTLYNNTRDDVCKVSDIVNDSWSNAKDQYEQAIDYQISLGIYAADQKPRLMQNGENVFKAFYKKELGIDDLKTTTSGSSTENKILGSDIQNLTSAQKQALLDNISEAQSGKIIKITSDNDNSGWLNRTADFLQQNIAKPIADLGSGVWSGIQSVILRFKLILFISLFLTNCVGIGVFHKLEEKKNKFPFEYNCSEINNNSCFPSSIRKKDLIKKRGNPQSVEMINENEEKLFYRKGFGWSGLILMLGIPIPIGVPTYIKYEYLYFRDGILFKSEEDVSEIYGVWYGFNGGVNNKAHKVEWFGHVVKLKPKYD